MAPRFPKLDIKFSTLPRYHKVPQTRPVFPNRVTAKRHWDPHVRLIADGRLDYILGITLSAQQQMRTGPAAITHEGAEPADTRTPLLVSAAARFLRYYRVGVKVVGISAY